MAEWHFVAQRALTGEFLELDLPLQDAELTWTLSGAGSLRATISPDVGRLRSADGRLLLEEWSTLIYAEADGEIRWGGILVRSSFPGNEWELEAAGFATYPNGLTFDGAMSFTQSDPIAPFAALWDNAQYRRNARLGVQVVSDPTPARVGLRGMAGANSPIGPGDVTDEQWADLILAEWEVHNGTLFPPLRRYRDAYTQAQWDAMGEAGGWVAVELDPPADKLPLAVADLTAEQVTFLRDHGWYGTGASLLPPRMYFDPQVQEIDAEPYTLNWWDSPDIGQKLDDLATSTPFDYTEKHFWTPTAESVEVTGLDSDLVAWMLKHGWTSDPTDGSERLYRPAVVSPADEVAHVIRTHYPRTGRRRDDLVFVEGDNIAEVVAVERDGDDYANAVTGLGAGEGAAALRREVAVQDGRLYRQATFTDKSILSAWELDSKLNDELAWRGTALDITSITVRSSPNAPIGSWSLGDDILVQADVPWLGEISLWCRITAWTLLSEDRAALTLVRSDSFRYGG